MLGEGPPPYGGRSGDYGDPESPRPDGFFGGADRNRLERRPSLNAHQSHQSRRSVEQLRPSGLSGGYAPPPPPAPEYGAAGRLWRGWDGRRRVWGQGAGRVWGVRKQDSCCSSCRCSFSCCCSFPGAVRTASCRHPTAGLSEHGPPAGSCEQAAAGSVAREPDVEFAK